MGEGPFTDGVGGKLRITHLLGTAPIDNSALASSSTQPHTGSKHTSMINNWGLEDNPHYKKIMGAALIETCAWKMKQEKKKFEAIRNRELVRATKGVLGNDTTRHYPQTKRRRASNDINVPLSRHSAIPSTPGHNRSATPCDAPHDADEALLSQEEGAMED
ncbi:hypothetical protein BDZ94DRAFT_1239916 [Collybia nuda]|uniref:Uncharacterized protein n=1 Tax=Collybia nuda TaxID=64659 RepID=A0A9P5XXT5_9AGAR|nr:hypothetical protein BDZ94DRAFT_1239916 [Collybia nuda]